MWDTGRTQARGSQQHANSLFLFRTREDLIRQTQRVYDEQRRAHIHEFLSSRLYAI